MKFKDTAHVTCFIPFEVDAETIEQAENMIEMDLNSHIDGDPEAIQFHSVETIEEVED